MERVYLSIGQRLDRDIEKHLKIKHESDGKHGQVTISFGGKEKAENSNEIFAIISNVTKLKDHFKNLYASKGGDVKLIESDIESSEYLKLLIDLDNQEKHYNLKKSRSGKYPYLDRIGRSLSIKAGQPSQKGSFTVDPFTGDFKTEGDVIVILTADIKDKAGVKICSFDELIDKSMEKWGEVIKKYNLI